MKKIVKKSVISTRCNPTAESLAIGNREENKHGYIGELVKLNLIDLEFADYQKELNVPPCTEDCEQVRHQQDASH